MTTYRITYQAHDSKWIETLYLSATGRLAAKALARQLMPNLINIVTIDEVTP